MFCRYCGKEITENASFCSFCGKRQQKISTTKEVYSGRTHEKWNIMEIIAQGVLLAVILVLCILFIKINSIEGVWYQINQENGNGPETYFNFTSDGIFVGNRRISGTYSAENGDLILQYNPLYGSRHYNYEIKWGKLYLNNGRYTYIYSRVKPEGWRDGSVKYINLYE